MKRAPSFRLREGFRLKKGLSPQRVGDELYRLQKEGRGEPSDVVEAARSPKSPMHAQFEWDDSKAAEAHRLEQARYLIRSIEVVYSEVGGGEVAAKAFHVVQGEKSRSYAPVFVERQQSQISEVVERERAVLAGCRARLAVYGKFEKTVSLIDRALAQLGEAKRAKPVKPARKAA